MIKNRGPKDYELVERKTFPLLPDAWIRMALLWGSESEDEQLKTVQGPDTAILDDLLIRLFDPKRLYYKKWLDHNHIKITYFSDRRSVRSPLFWKTQPGAEAAIPFANASCYNIVQTVKMMLESNPNLATSRNLLEVVNEYGDIDIARVGTLFDLLDVVIFESVARDSYSPPPIHGSIHKSCSADSRTLKGFFQLVQ